MAKPILVINGTDYTEYVGQEGFQATREDLDADGSGRNILTGLMYRSRIATKMTYAVSLNRISASTLKSLISDLYSGTNYVTVKVLDAKSNSTVTKTVYCSSITEGTQRYINGSVYYDGVTFNLIER